jgi:hypothetical protein
MLDGRGNNMKKTQNGNLVTDPPSTPDNNGNKPGSKNASGPKTPAGKSRVRFNARTHGFFAKELVVLDEDRADFESLKKKIRTELKPTTLMQQLAVERVVSATWRHKLALRMEARRLKPLLESSDPPESGESAIQAPRWYTSGRQELNRAAKFLAELRAEVQAYGDQHLEKQKDLIVTVFGSDFYDSLTQWGPINTVWILGSEQMQLHSERFKNPLPEKVLLPAQVTAAAGRVRWDMIVKVVDLKLQEISEHYRFHDRSAGAAEPTQTVALDGVNRYLTSTRRELEHAVEWYWDLLEKGL